MVLAAQAHARERQVFHRDALLVELADLAMQLTAVTALHIGEDGDGVLRVGRREHDAVGLGHGVQLLAAVGQQARAGGELLVLDVERLRLDQVTTVVADVQHLPADDHFAKAGERRSADVIGFEIRVQRLERRAHALVHGAGAGGGGRSGWLGAGSACRRLRGLCAGGKADRAQQRGDGKTIHSRIQME